MTHCSEPAGSRPGRMVLAVAALAASCTWLTALAQSDVRGSADHPLIERFPESTIVEYDTRPDVNYNLVLGNLRRIGGRVVAEESQRVRGNLTRLTYEAPETFDSTDVFEFFAQQAGNAGYVPLFRCSGRGCGNSNYWANDIFDNRFLYGPERSQHYLALEVPVAGGANDYIAIYVITRTNRRLLAHIEILEPGDIDTALPMDALQTRLQQVGSVIIEGLDFDGQDQLVNNAGLEVIISLLQSLQRQDAYIVAHLQAAGSLDDTIARSQIRAQAVVAALANQGLDISGLAARGVGPLAPACDGTDCGDRIELVLP